MITRHTAPAVLAFLMLSVCLVAAEPVTVLFFGQPGCPECELVKRDVLPDLEVVFPGQYRLEMLDVSAPAHAGRLIAAQDAFDAWDNEPVSILVGGRIFLTGVNSIRDQLLPAIQTVLDEQDTGDPRSGHPPDDTGDGMLAAAERRVARFTVPGVILAGLGDSLNPCAISVLVFFVSVLAMAKVRGGRLLVAGAAFIGAGFTTYFLLGLGFLTVLRSLSGFDSLKAVVDWTMIVVLLILAGVSTRDAWAYHRRRNPADVRLQLPPRIKDWIRRLTLREIKTHRLAVAAAVIGAGVTLLESVCTGQIYLPALVLMARAGQSMPRVLGLLVLYNAMFVLPLIVVFAMLAKGLEMPALLAWSRRHVTPAKLLMAMVFLGMALGVYLL